MSEESDVRKLAKELTKKLMDSGQIIEAGWVGLRVSAIPPDAPQIQIDSMRDAFYAGAQHLFSSVVSALDPDKDPTEDDLRRMAMIHSELTEFFRQFRQRHGIDDDEPEKSQG